MFKRAENMDKSIFLHYNMFGGELMNSFFYKKVNSSELLADKYIHVNNFGYYKDIRKMRICRKNGRLDYQLIYLKKGELLIGEGDSCHILKGGSICLFRPKEAQIYSVNGVESTYYWIHFSGNEAESMLSFFKERAYRVGVVPEFEYYCHGPTDAMNADEEYVELLCEGRLIALIAKIAQCITIDKGRSKSMKMISPALAAINSGSSIQFTNDELAQLCNLSKSYFIKTFKEAMGVSPQQYYTSLIVNKGCYLLANTFYNIGEISHLCGIDDSLYFSRLFKKHMGISPQNYRKKHVPRANEQTINCD